MKKIVKDLKVEIESLMKTQTEGTLEIKILGTIRTSEVNFNIIQKMGERISDTEDKLGKKWCLVQKEY